MANADTPGWVVRRGSAPAGERGRNGGPGGPAGAAQMILDLSDMVGQGQEQGLLGVVADPDFPARTYIYVFYTRAHQSGHCLQ